MYNHTGLQGRLTADPELRYTQQGAAITSFTLASDTGRKTKDGKKITNFIECVAWRAQAEFVCKYLSKGRRPLRPLPHQGPTSGRHWNMAEPQLRGQGREPPQSRRDHGRLRPLLRQQEGRRPELWQRLRRSGLL